MNESENKETADTGVNEEMWMVIHFSLSRGDFPNKLKYSAGTSSVKGSKGATRKLYTCFSSQCVIQDFWVCCKYILYL